MNENTRIAVIGLGYVGLPLAVALAKVFSVVGFDTDANRVAELLEGVDRTREVAPEALRSSSLACSADPSDAAGADIYIVTVPTPITADNSPDLGPLRRASGTVGSLLGRNAIVVYESTVYPGVTENVCGPILENASGLKCGEDFFLGYSPERTNPGDQLRTVGMLNKVVAGQTPATTKTLVELYSSITLGKIFRAADIRTAEAAKIIENAQRDINIAFINEVATIFGKMGISTLDVLEAAETKWNYLDFRPGLVGGHCVGIDPFYLAHAASAVGHTPEITLAGRRINDRMGYYVAECVAAKLTEPNARVLVLGLTFKENVPDIRNSRAIDIVRGLRGRGFSVDVHDALVDRAEAKRAYGLDPLPSLDAASGYDCVVGAVAHKAYAAFDASKIAALVSPCGLVADVKGMWRWVVLPGKVRRWQL